LNQCAVNTSVVLALTKVDFGRLSNKETEKAIGQLVGWSVFSRLSTYIVIQSYTLDDKKDM
jgi:hypothetical protein